METLPVISLLINIIILIPVCIIILYFEDTASFAYGVNTPSRQILLSMYLSILVFSIFLLVNRIYYGKSNNVSIISLLTVQIIYKILSVGLVTAPNNPVKWANLIVAIIHMFTVYTMF
jgi:hypothetical protein